MYCFRCVSKRQCFAPPALFQPFGEQAAGVCSLAQFRALRDGDKKLDELRDVGLTEDEIQLWTNKDNMCNTDKARGVVADPSALQQRLQQITDKMAARSELLSRPQRFTSSRALSRREMEIEQSLYQGHQQGYLSALYHRDEVPEDDQQESPSCLSMDSVYKEVLNEDRVKASKTNRKHKKIKNEQLQTQEDEAEQSEQASSEQEEKTNQSEPCKLDEQIRLVPLTAIDLKQPISRLRAGSRVPLTVTGEVEIISDEEILSNRESDDVIRIVPRFRNYQPGLPSKVLCVKNLSAQATVAQLVALFSRFEQKTGPAVVYKLLTGRLKGQAFVTLSDADTAQNALQMIHGYRLLGKPLVVEFGREKLKSELTQQSTNDLEPSD